LKNEKNGESIRDFTVINRHDFILGAVSPSKGFFFVQIVYDKFLFPDEDGYCILSG